MTTKRRLIELLELLSGSVLPIIFWASLIFGFDTPYVAVLTIISAILHEIGHYAAISLLTADGCSVKGHASGFRIRKSKPIGYAGGIAILLAGPAVNILLFLISLPFNNFLFGYFRIFGLINLATGISNLLPFEGYDGYGILREIFLSIDHPEYISKLETLSFIFGTGITFVSLYLIDRLDAGYWIFGLFFFATMTKLINFGKYDIFGE